VAGFTSFEEGFDTVCEVREAAELRPSGDYGDGLRNELPKPAETGEVVAATWTVDDISGSG
jgi:hypothetical protein